MNARQIELAIEASQRLTRRLIEASLAHGTAARSDAQYRVEETLGTVAACVGRRLVELEAA